MSYRQFKPAVTDKHDIGIALRGAISTSSVTDGLRGIIQRLDGAIGYSMSEVHEESKHNSAPLQKYLARLVFCLAALEFPECVLQQPSARNYECLTSQII